MSSRHLLLLSMALTACAWGNYRVVDKTPEGGEVALVGSGEAEARKKAEAYMASVCPNGFTITEESEAAASDESGSSEASTDIIGHNKQRSAAIANEDRRESRLKYRCKS